MAPTDPLVIALRQGIQADSGIWYNNLQQLGSGGSAVTYLMLADGGSIRGVCFAVKLFRRVSMPERRDRFLKEIGFLRTCDHPCIMRIFDEGVYRDKHPFIVAEYLPRTLMDVIRSNSSTLVEKLNFVLQLLSALVYLDHNEHRVIHRDVKPQNIFVKGRSCVLGDFGLMKSLTTEEDAAARVEAIKDSVGPGMPFYYRTPELVSYARGESNDITTKSDVFQLGLVVAQLFSGRNPQRRAENNDFLADVVLEERSTWISQIPVAFHDSIVNLIESMLNMNASERPSAADLLAPWRGVFLAVAEQQEALEGRVFR